MTSSSDGAGGPAVRDGAGARWWWESRFPLFLASRALSLTGDMAAVSALTLHIYQETASGLAVAGLFVARVLPRLFGALAGAMGDRVDLRRLLITCDLAAGLLFVAIAWSQPGYQLLLIMVLAAESVATVTAPASQTLVARTVPPDKLARANSTVMAIMAISFVSGAAIGSLSVVAWGYQYALYADALSFGLSAVLVAAIPRVPPSVRHAADGRSFLSSTFAGLRELRRDRHVTAVATAMIGVTFAGSLDRPALVLLTQHDLHGSGLAYGLALGGVSIGALVATASMDRTRLLTPSVTTLLAGLLLQAAGHVTMGLAPVLAVVVVGTLIAGFGDGTEGITGTTLLQRAAEGRSVGLLMGVVMSGSYLADAIGSITGGVLVGVAGARWTFMISAALMVTFVLVVARTERNQNRERSAR